MVPVATWNELLQYAPVIAPSMLKCDFGNLHREVQLLEAGGARVLHLDVMDGHFVPNLSYGPMVIERLREITDLPFDAHLMIADPETYLEQFISAGCNSVTIHVEAVDDPAPLLRRIRDANCSPGLALNPETAVERVLPFIDLCDLLLVMSVHPGFGGQKFLPAALDKLRALKARTGSEMLLSVDGGIGPSTIGEAAAAGANYFVAGSSIFEARDYSTAIAELEKIASGSTNSPLEN